MKKNKKKKIGVCYGHRLSHWKIARKTDYISFLSICIVALLSDLLKN